MDREQLEAAARNLDVNERARLVVALIDSLEADDEMLDEAAWEDAWRAELERRLASVDLEDTETLPDRATVMARLRTRRDG